MNFTIALLFLSFRQDENKSGEEGVAASTETQLLYKRGLHLNQVLKGDLIQEGWQVGGLGTPVQLNTIVLKINITFVKFTILSFC